MTQTTGPEPALAAGEDPRRYAQILTAVYDATMAGGKSPARPRDVIGDSWRRLQTLGIDPEQRSVASPQIDVSDLELSRRESGLFDILDDLGRGLESVVQDGDNILVVADRHGRVLWRSGSTSVLDRADGLGFVEGASWAEDSVGTNAIGTALVSRRAVQIFSAEHYVRSHHPWTCAGAPIKDPRTGHVIGAVDVSGPANTVHPTTLALVDAIARLAESQLREHHRQNLDRLRSVAAPMLARLQAPALAVDANGWVAAVESVALRNRVLLPEDVVAGRFWLPTLGVCDFEPLPGGWLVRPTGDEASETGRTTVSLDLRHHQHVRVQIRSEVGEWTHEPTPRHAEILYLLASSREGRSAAQLAADLFGDDGRAITVRAEMSRLRKHMSGIVQTQPYRFDETAVVDVLLPEDPSRLLPHSTAPAVVRMRRS
ncbi:diguanylate cyclase [Rhodococcus sp. RS1C4]|uniref:GAF domain-containing protein n=1 Tax=Nocardiaceae TaxID=85025 RepID=UPI000369F124|nr:MULTISPECIES: GAF domain-containing protein [Rhodococcus]OZC53013.1 diguanylate cyclase [Rhodococcus sp. RS1C4]OZC77541.1 diguanylate cyclase [Rhodococcus sp. 06-418-1B]OZC77646.1 diguanylate cyclase [Rhodococcus sp. 06-418-1B]OZD14964.1 diguanylate cyclase [Rhodococcus sp. 06-156-4C]OZD19953.1 diguanylate cyclase [Rhodococcus sp. 06-156-4a]